MLTREFDYALPPEAVAQYPLPRGQARLLALDASPPHRHLRVEDLPRHLNRGDLLVVNNTRVVKARLLGRRSGGGGRLELLLVKKEADTTWQVLIRPGRRVRPGMEIRFDEQLAARLLSKENGRYRVEFSDAVERHWERLGHLPLPPYIKRPVEAEDHERYQTLFAHRPGSIAAPTAGLHFSPELLRRLAEQGVARTEVTLHVGIGTFKPVRVEDVAEHRMESEDYWVSPEAARDIRRTRERGGRIVAVGTTVVRTLEAAALRGAGEVHAGSGSTALFITPGFCFQVVDLLLTNFHLPRSTLLMLVCAFAGRERVIEAYGEAVAAGYRFYSYGDALLATRR